MAQVIQRYVNVPVTVFPLPSVSNICFNLYNNVLYNSFPNLQYVCWFPSRHSLFVIEKVHCRHNHSLES